MKKIIFIAIAVIAVGVAAYFLFFNNKAEAEPEVILYNYAIEDAFITNVKNSQKLFKTSIILVVNQKEMDAQLDENIYAIRDTILMILRDLTVEDISSDDIQSRLRVDISTALNKVLKIDNFVSVYFGDFVMQ